MVGNFVICAYQKYQFDIIIHSNIFISWRKHKRKMTKNLIESLSKYFAHFSSNTE